MRMNKVHFQFLFIVVSVLIFKTPLHSEVKLPAIIGDNMVLQAKKPLPIWGWANPGEEVTVKLGKHKKITKADDSGNWKVILPEQKASAKPQGMIIQGDNKIGIKNILIGEVWVGSGQSNMEWSLRQSAGSVLNISKAKYPRIRLFHVPKTQTGSPAKDVKASWKVCDPKNVTHFSAVLYHFGKKIHGTLKYPVGLINSSWGGSRIEPWISHEGHSGKMYNGMIAPVQPFSIRGVIWYQGESNVADGLNYYDKKVSLIDGWRKVWGKDMPFYFVQIAPFSGYRNGHLPGLWEGQVKCLKIPNTGMAVTTDIVHNIRDIHPSNKHDVGERLARWALARTYGKKKIVVSGPLYKSMMVEEDKIRIFFAHAKGGLGSRDKKPLTEFEIAGQDGQYVKAVAVVDKETVLVSSPMVKEPKFVRFGWHKMCNPNLINRAGLPASPFKTFDWEGGTAEEESKSKKKKKK